MVGCVQVSACSNGDAYLTRIENILHRKVLGETMNILKQKGLGEALSAEVAAFVGPLKVPVVSSTLNELACECGLDDEEAAAACSEVDKRLSQLKKGGDERASAIAAFANMAFKTKASCCAAQVVLKESPVDDQRALVSSLSGIIVKAVRHRHANYVVQKVIQVLPQADFSFVIQELLSVGSDLARHQISCRTLCRILEHGDLSDGTTSQLLDKVLEDASDLCKHQYGSHVICHFLEYGYTDHHQIITFAICFALPESAKFRHGCMVVKKALQCVCADYRCFMIQHLERCKETLRSTRPGRQIIQELLVLENANSSSMASSWQSQQDGSGNVAPQCQLHVR